MRVMMTRRELVARLGAAATAVALAPPAAALAGGGVYQRIWDADQAGRGVPAIPAGARGDRRQGFVKIDERAGQGPEHRLFAEVSIPEPKRQTYDLCRAMVDNYRLDQTKHEDNRPEEARETLALLEVVTDSAPMAAAREQLERDRGVRYSRDEWQELIFDIWFRQFDDGRNLDLSGFEHVAIGEQRGGTVNGHHFWYKYYLDDWPVFLDRDDIDYDGSRYDGPNRRDGRLTALGRQVPEIATLAYRWDAYDFDAGQRRSLYKPIGGFWIGCSIEGLMALGVVRFFARGRVEATINRARYQIDLHRSPDGRSLRTCFPRFLGLA